MKRERSGAAQALPGIAVLALLTLFAVVSTMLAVFGAQQGAVMERAAVAAPGGGRCQITGIVEEEELDGGGHAFLLCSDGFWEYVLEPEMEKDLNSAAGPEDWLERMRWRLKKRIPENNDNNTAAAVWINER